MTLPPIIAELLQLLFGLAVPAAICTMVLAGLALRREGGINFQSGGGFQKWMLWSVILLTLPQLLSWFSGQGAVLPPQTGAPSAWMAPMQNVFNSFVMNIIVARFIPVIAAFFVMKAALDGAQGHSPLGSIVTAIFLLAVTSTVQMMQSWNSGTPFATTDMLVSAWNYLAGNILPEAAGLAIVGAIFNFLRHKPIVPLIGTALAFLSISGVWKLVETMVG